MTQAGEFASAALAVEWMHEFQFENSNPAHSPPTPTSPSRPVKYHSYFMLRSLRLCFRNPRKGYDLLGAPIPWRYPHASRVLHLCLRWLLPALFLLLLLSLTISGIPPSYADIREYESKLPQHNISALTPGSRRYLHVAGQLVGHGFNNILTQA